MERLTENENHADDAEARLAELLRACQGSRQVAIPPGRKQFLLRGVLTGRRSKGSRMAVLLRPVVAMSVLLLAGATLAATAGHDFLARGLRRLTFGAPVEPPALIAAGADTKVVRQTHPTPLVPEDPPAAVGTEAMAVPADARPAVPATASSSGSRSHAPARSIDRLRSARGEDPSKVVAAVRALRSDHDAERARKLLAAYLQQYPNGALSEEALALSIEAATDLHDASAATFATRYLRAYPSGRFRRAAEQALRLP